MRGWGLPHRAEPQKMQRILTNVSGETARTGGPFGAVCLYVTSGQGLLSNTCWTCVCRDVTQRNRGAVHHGGLIENVFACGQRSGNVESKRRNMRVSGVIRQQRLESRTRAAKSHRPLRRTAGTDKIQQACCGESECGCGPSVLATPLGPARWKR
jgi:hypothetical protein